MQIKTGISQAYWTEDGKLVAARRVAIRKGRPSLGEEISWFDALLEGGLVLPKKEGPLVILVEGPPGAGKSTFCMELCSSLVGSACDKVGAESDRFAHCLYRSTDTDSRSIVENFRSIRGLKPTDPCNVQSFEPGARTRTQRGQVLVVGRERRGDGAGTGLADRLKDASIPSVPIPIFGGPVRDYLKILMQEVRRSRKKRGESEIPTSEEHLCSREQLPWLVCFDSLNVLRPEMYGDMFEEQFQHLCREHTKIAVFVLDGPTGGERKHWQFSADVIIRLGESRSRRNYYTRQIEIVKARYQPHVWGTHQLKIYAPQESMSGQRAPKYARGGIYVVPSLHFHLSRYRRRSEHEMPTFARVSEREAPTDYPARLVRLLDLPEGQCTAFVGPRSAHKSHVAYAEVIRHVRSHPEARALIVSLRDDVPAIEARLNRIREEEFSDSKPDLLRRIDKEYFHPGYITAEEFFHRVYLRLNFLKSKTGVRPLVLVNSLDQLTARFPLCADEGIFVPALVEAMCGEGATSIFVAVMERDQPASQFGLLPMAEQIVSFDSREQEVSKIEAALEVPGAYGAGAAGRRPIVRVSIARARAGQKAGTGGVLDLITDEVLQDATEEVRARVARGLYFKQVSDDWWPPGGECGSAGSVCP